MKIIDKRTITQGNFGNLEVGDVFYIERFEEEPWDENYESDLYMKTGVKKQAVCKSDKWGVSSL